MHMLLIANSKNAAIAPMQRKKKKSTLLYLVVLITCS